MTDASPDTGPDTTLMTEQSYKLAMVALTVVAVVAFALSFHGIFDLLIRVGRLPWWLAWLGPIMIDFFALVGIFTGHAMRHAPRRRRAYAWFVTLIATALSVIGNVSDAQARHLDMIGLGIFAVAPPIIFLASHLIVVCRRELEDRRAWTERATAMEAESVAEGETDTTGDGRATRPLDAKAYAIRQARRGWPVSRIHASLIERGDKVHERTVARWTRDYRITQSDLVALAKEDVTS